MRRRYFDANNFDELLLWKVRDLFEKMNVRGDLAFSLNRFVRGMGQFSG
jgi:hypothetical protein